MTTALDPDRQAALHAAKLRVLATEVLGLTDVTADGQATGATATGTGPDGVRTAVVLAEARADRGLGRALAHARSVDAGSLHVLAPADDAAVLARRAARFAAPPTVWTVDGRDLRPAEPAEPLPTFGVPDGVDHLIHVLLDAGTEIVVEYGVVSGEVRGLEIAVIAESPDGPVIEAGVGRHDREAFALLHGHLPPLDAVRQVVEQVDRHRRADAPHHPLNRFSIERWLRRAVIARPAAVGCAALEPAEPPLPRTGVKDPHPAVATGTDAAGGEVVVVSSTGIDLDVVPFAADARFRLAPDARLVIAVPERDAHPVTLALAASLAEPAEVVRVPPDWRTWT